MQIKRFVYASSSSVYGDSPELPKVEERTGKVLFPYAITKLVNEEYARIFGNLYGMEKNRGSAISTSLADGRIPTDRTQQSSRNSRCHS